MPDTLPPLRIAFLGGNGHHYLSGALSDPAIDIEAIAVAPGYCDADDARRRFSAQLEAGAAWYDSAEALLDDFAPSVVSVGTWYAHNGPVALQALERGIAAVSDKPVAADWETLARLESVLVDGGPVLATEFDFRSRPTFRAAAQAVADGLLGDIVLANGQKSYRFGTRADFYRRREDYGSTLLWIASHAIDSIPFVTGQTLTCTAAQHGNVAKPDYGSMEDQCAAMFRLSGGGTAVVHADFHRPAAAPTHGDDRLRVVGSKGQLEVRDDQCILITHDQGPRDIADTASPKPIHRELLAAVLAGDDAYFGNAPTLELARILLQTRDLADGRSA